MSELTRVITREQAEEWGLPHEASESEEHAKTWNLALEVHRERLEERRWYSRNRLVFRAPDDGQTWAVTYKEGLTEVQEGTDPWNESDTVTLTRYEPYEKTITAWRPASAAIVAGAGEASDHDGGEQ